MDSAGGSGKWLHRYQHIVSLELQRMFAGTLKDIKDVQLIRITSQHNSGYSCNTSEHSEMMTAYIHNIICLTRMTLMLVNQLKTTKSLNYCSSVKYSSMRFSNLKSHPAVYEILPSKARSIHYTLQRKQSHLFMEVYTGWPSVCLTNSNNYHKNTMRRRM